MCIYLYVCHLKVAELFRNDGSGSGDGNVDFFFPTVHQHGKLFQLILFLLLTIIFFINYCTDTTCQSVTLFAITSD